MTYSAPASNTSKANVEAALKASFEECDRAYKSMDDTSGMQMVTTYMGAVPKLAAMAMNNQHDAQEYGVLTVYMRLKGIVPPSTARAAASRAERGHKH